MLSVLHIVAVLFAWWFIMASILCWLHGASIYEYELREMQRRQAARDRRMGTPQVPCSRGPEGDPAQVGNAAGGTHDMIRTCEVCGVTDIAKQADCPFRGCNIVDEPETHDLSLHGITAATSQAFIDDLARTLNGIAPGGAGCFISCSPRAIRNIQRASLLADGPAVELKRGADDRAEMAIMDAVFVPDYSSREPAVEPIRIIRPGKMPFIAGPHQATCDAFAEDGLRMIPVVVITALAVVVGFGFGLLVGIPIAYDRGMSAGVSRVCRQVFEDGRAAVRQSADAAEKAA